MDSALPPEPYWPVEWVEDAGRQSHVPRGQLRLLDQRQLPHRTVYETYTDHAAVAQAIRDMVVRGAPAIGAAGAYGYVLGVRNGIPREQVYVQLLQSRPTAVNLEWALRQLHEAGNIAADKLLHKAHALLERERRHNWAMAEHGAQAILGDARLRVADRPLRVLHHCNTGALATAGWGTALGVVRRLHQLHPHLLVHVNETRPRLQGARLTCWELGQWGIPHRLQVDGAVAHLMSTGQVDAVLVGADRVTADASVANKIGTLTVAVCAAHYGVPLYVCAPLSTVDVQTVRGADIRIEERDAAEVVNPHGSAPDSRSSFAPVGTPVYNPAFDVTPAALITGGIVTECGVARHLERLHQNAEHSGMAEQLARWKVPGA
ncbi:hypothetical protein CDCA_CDCA12G3487 [Cyanidium caldarium]|uniref:Methylthioribose-1-phosphate isomerase n=1 Tax=Cyanidium caldarium TaxID=2771 RepID=A0AAV9IYU7_CYACA|nr:hypothetical protein CDCA_CDCA12G3487 [Cyanidium caldarium]|eukprot:ctg_93.g25